MTCQVCATNDYQNDDNHTTDEHLNSGPPVGSSHEGRSDDRDLEAIIDGRGLASLAESIASIAREKAEHIRTNWQDEPLARTWDRAARAFDAASQSTPVRDVSR